MSNAEARAWWDDVQHLRPDAAPAARSRTSSALKSVDDLPTAAELDAWLAEESAPNRFTRAAELAEVEVDPAPEPPARPARPARPVRAPREDLGVEIALQRRPSVEPAPRGTSGAEGLIAARAAEAAAVAGPALRRAAREVADRKPRSPLDRTLSTPDRIAMWAVILGVLLVVIAATTSSAQAAIIL